MTDYDIPELPSDKDLGITPEDVEAFETEAEGKKKPEKGDSGKGGGGAKPPKPSKAPPQTAPQGGSRGLITLVVLLVAAWLASTGPAVPRPVQANAPDTAFSSARAMSELVEIARRPRPPGSPEHARVEAYLLQRLTELGLEPRVDSTTSMVRRGPSIRAAKVHNIVARMRGTASSGAVLIAAHYDSGPQAVGAADDGAGVVAIMETVRALRAGPPLKNDVIVLFTDAEEEGLLGARAFAAGDPSMSDVRLVLNFDMRGAAGPAIMFQTGPQDGWVVHQFARSNAHAFANSISGAVWERMPNDTDFSVFLDAGVQGLNFAAIGDPDVYHESWDVPENLSEGTLQDLGLQAISALRTLGGADLSSVSGPDVVYFRVPFRGVVSYPEAWIIPITVLVLLLFGGVVVLARRNGLRWSGMVAGVGLGAIAVAATYGLGALLFPWVARFHPELGALPGSAFHREGWYVLALVAGSFTLLMTLVGIARMRYTTGELSVGAMVLPTGAAVAATFMVPAGAMNLQWPALSALLATAVAVGYVQRGRAGKLGWVLTILLALPVLMFLVPLIQLLWLVVTIRMAATLGALITLTLLLILPALGLLEEPNRWWPPLGGLAVGAICLGVGSMLARPSATRPAPSTLLYALDHPSGDAIWATRPGANPSDSTPDPARAWARQQAGGAFTGERFLSPFFFQRRLYAVAPARPVQAPGPDVAVASDTLVAGGRSVRVAIRSRIGAERILVRLPADSVASLRTVDGVAVPPPDSSRNPLEVPVLDHWGGGRDSLTLGFAVDSATTSVELVVVEHLYRPQAVLGEDAFRRPPNLAPNVREASDQVMFRSVVYVSPGTGEVRREGGAGGAEGPTPVGAGARPDSVAAGADTAALRSDTGAARSDTTPTSPGTNAARPDTTTVHPDSAARGDSAVVGSDTGTVHPDSVAARSDAGTERADSAAAGSDAGGAGPDVRPSTR